MLNQNQQSTKISPLSRVEGDSCSSAEAKEMARYFGRPSKGALAAMKPLMPRSADYRSDNQIQEEV